MPSRIRSSTHTLNYIWISDDVLSAAFHRFARVSRAHIRHESHVPGPMEARKRWPKRRMGMVAAIPEPNLLPLFDFGTLFSFKSIFKQPSIEKGWTWQAPSPKNPTFEKSTTNCQSPRKEDYKVTVKTTATQAEHIFETLLSALRNVHNVEAKTLSPLLKFLQSTRDHPDAHNISRLLEWLENRETDASALDDVYSLIRERVASRTLAERELCHILHELNKDFRSKHACVRATDLLDALPAEDVPRVIRTTTISMMSAQSAISERDLDMMRGWLTSIRNSMHAYGPHFQNATWEAVYHPIASFWDFAQLSQHFKFLQPLDMSRVMLQYWVSPYLTGKRGAKHLYSQCPEHLSSKLDEMRIEFEKLHHARNQSLERTKYSPLFDLFEILQTHKVPYAKLTFDVFTLIIRHESMEVLRCAFDELCGTELLEANPRNRGLRLIKIALSTGRPWHLRWAMELFESHPDIALSEVAEIPLLFIDAGMVKGTDTLRIYEMLRRPHPKDRVGTETRPNHNMPLAPRIVELAQLIASKWAHSPAISALTAWKRVWECFRFLKSHRAPLSPILSRAGVEAGVLRYVRNSRRVPAVQLKYVLSLVEEVEGAAQARIALTMIKALFDQNKYIRTLPQPLPPTREVQRFASKRRWHDMHGAPSVISRYASWRGTMYGPGPLAREQAKQNAIKRTRGRLRRPNFRVGLRSIQYYVDMKKAE